MEPQEYKYKTIVVSDVHLGMKDTKVKELITYLSERSTETLILNGDIIDGWRLRGSGKWKKKYTRFWKYLIKISEYTKIVYLKGNHDDFLEHIAPFGFANFRIMNEYTIHSKGKKYPVIHGDVFDAVTKRVVWLSKFGASGYNFLLAYNRFYNRRRLKKGLPYKSVSQEIKRKVKMAANMVDTFEQKAIALANNMEYDGIICGHIHTPADKMIDGIHYLNSGDWVETMSALTEDFEGNWNIERYEGVVQSHIRLERKPRFRSLRKNR
jgi:UDP-2,3-diacylglucosamine pyrophosphatase LpxH